MCGRNGQPQQTLPVVVRQQDVLVRRIAPKRDDAALAGDPLDGGMRCAAEQLPDIAGLPVGEEEIRPFKLRKTSSAADDSAGHRVSLVVQIAAEMEMRVFEFRIDGTEASRRYAGSA